MFLWIVARGTLLCSIDSATKRTSMLYMARRCKWPQPPRVTRTRGWTLSASSLSRLPPKAAASTGGALEQPRVPEQQPTPGLSHQTRSPTISLTQPTSLKNAHQYVTDSKDGARRLARRGRVTRSPTPVNVGRRGRRGGRPRGTTRSCPVFVDAGRLPPRGTTRACPSATADGDRRGRRCRRPRGTTRPSPLATADGDRRGQRGGRRGGRPRGTTRACPVVVDAGRPASAEGHGGGVSCARQPQPMETGRHDAVVPSLRSHPPEAPRPLFPQTDDAAASTAGWEGGMQPASKAVTLPTGTRGGQGREVQASAAARTGE